MFVDKVLTIFKNRQSGLAAFLLMVSAAFALSACASSTAEDGVNDPIEGVNRATFAFNKVVDDAVIYPTLKGYQQVVPSPARTGLKNVVRNLKTPVTFANQLLQGDFDGAGDVLLRATINSSVGFAGLVDIAGYEGIPYEREDFGQTLAIWGIGHGPYLVVPLFGPSSARDLAGSIVDSLADPLRLYWHNVDEVGRNNVRASVSYIVLKERLMDIMESLEYGAIDYYATVRSAYYQNRAAEVQDQSPDAVSFADIPDYDD